MVVLDANVTQSPSSIDIMLGVFSSIHGDPRGNKNDVIKDVQWELTGRVNTQYAAPGAVWKEKEDGEEEKVCVGRVC